MRISGLAGKMTGPRPEGAALIAAASAGEMEDGAPPSTVPTPAVVAARANPTRATSRSGAVMRTDKAYAVVAPHSGLATFPTCPLRPRPPPFGRMTEEQWAAVDRYLADLLVPSDPALDAALAASAAAGLPPIHVAPNQGKLLALLVQLQSARSVLEIGTLGGYSTIWMARALPAGGRLVTLEADPKHAEVARENIRRAGLADVVELRLGPALETLPQLAAQGAGPFDFVFIDADKPSNPEYFTWALQLSRLGGVIVVDNVVWGGAVIDATSTDPSVRGTRRLHELLAAERRVSATVLQTVGSKGYDGLAIALVTAGP